MIKNMLSLMIIASKNSVKKNTAKGKFGYPNTLEYRAKLYPSEQASKSPTTLTALSPLYACDVPKIIAYRW